MPEKNPKKNNELYNFYSSVESSEVEWLWYPYIPYGKITILQGDPGDGKSTLALNIASVLTNGGCFPDGKKVEKPEVVIYQCPEDSSSDTVKPRLIQAGADCEKVAYIVESGERLTLNNQKIEETISATGARLLILDPLQSFVGQEGDMQNAGRMRNTMQNLADLAEEYRCAVLLIGHMNKSAGGKKIYRGLGSIDITAMARSVLMVTRDDGNPEIRYMFPVKSSLAPEGCAIGFILNSEYGFRWIGKCNISTEELRTRAEKRKSGKKELAKDLLKVMLSEDDMLVKEILEKMKEVGISDRTTRQAQKEMGIIAYKKKNVWYWKLPDPSNPENDKEINFNDSKEQTK